MKLNLVNSIMIAGIVSASAFGQSSGTTNQSKANLGNFYQRLKESPFSAKLYAEYGTERNAEKEIDAISHTYIGTLSYKMDEKNSFSLSPRWDYTPQIDDTESDMAFTNVSLNYYRSGILNEDEHGVSATFHGRVRYYPDNMSKISDEGANTYKGYWRAGMIFGKTLTEKLSASVPFYLAVYDRPTGNEELPTHYIYIPASLTYQINEKLSATLLGEYFHRMNKGDDIQSLETFDLTLELGYAYSETFTFLGGMKSDGFLKSHNGSMLPEEFGESLSYYVGASVKAF